MDDRFIVVEKLVPWFDQVFRIVDLHENQISTASVGGSWLTHMVRGWLANGTWAKDHLTWEDRRAE